MKFSSRIAGYTVDNVFGGGHDIYNADGSYVDESFINDVNGGSDIFFNDSFNITDY